MLAGGIGGEILPWRDVLHDGPVPADLSLAEMSRVRATYLASEGLGNFDDIAREFVARDATVEACPDFDRVVLWFEWDLYDQLQLIQLLDYFAGRIAADKPTPALESVWIGDYLGSLSADRFADLHEHRQPVAADALSLGRAMWRAFTSPDPRAIITVLSAGTSAIPYLDGAMWRLLEELPWTGDGLARSERQLLAPLLTGPAQFGSLFRHAADSEERVYLGDSSAASYIVRLSGGDNPLVAYASGEQIQPLRTEAEYRDFRTAEVALTDAGRDVLSGRRDWIEMGGSDRWLGGVHLDAGRAAWRWDPATRNVTSGLRHDDNA
jgi:hypothetical protein